MPEINFTGGLDPSMDLMVPDYPKDDPHYRESVSIWFFDDANNIQFPRFLIEDIPGQPEQRLSFYNIAFPDGRALVSYGPQPALSMLDERGRPTVYGAGPLAFRCLEPFRTWTATFRGQLTETRAETLIHGAPEGPRREVTVEIETRSAAPPWISGTMSAQARELFGRDSLEHSFVGKGFRYEQTVLVTGRCSIEGERYEFSGRGLRVHRRSSRNPAGKFRGHVWQTTVFPSGRAFGYTAFPPAGPGDRPFVEGFYFDGEAMWPADFPRIPWMTHAAPGPQDVSLTLATERQEIRIAAEVLATNFSTQRMAASSDGVPLLQQQGCALYHLGDEQAVGMIERSNFRDQLTFGA